MSASKKLIGLTGPSIFTPDLVQMIETFFHANPVLLYQNHEEHLNYWFERIDGLVLGGGVDIHPTVYGESIMNGANLSKFDLQRDLRELRAIHCCMERNVPIMGICRGHQILGVYHGMNIIQDISASSTCHNARGSINLAKNEPMHAVKILDSDVFQGDYCDMAKIDERKIIQLVLRPPVEKIFVNSFHHQGVYYDTKTDYNARIVGIARVDLSRDKESIVELMDGANFVSAQWHPEFDWEENSFSRAVLSKFKKMLEQKKK